MGRGAYPMPREGDPSGERGLPVGARRLPSDPESRSQWGEGSTHRGEAATRWSGEPIRSGRRVYLPDRRRWAAPGEALPNVYQGVPLWGRRSPLRGRCSPLRGRCSPLRGRCLPLKGRRSPLRGRRCPLEGRRCPLWGGCPLRISLQEPFGSTLPAPAASSVNFSLCRGRRAGSGKLIPHDKRLVPRRSSMPIGRTEALLRGTSLASNHREPVACRWASRGEDVLELVLIYAACSVDAYPSELTALACRSRLSK